MNLYIGNLPDQIDDYDLRKFFQIVGNQAGFRIVTHDTGGGRLQRYGLAEIDDEKLAFQLKARFNGKLFKDSIISVREYTHRSYSNDRRALNWRQMDWQGEERRRDDRRGGSLRHRRTASAVAEF